MKVINRPGTWRACRSEARRRLISCDPRMQPASRFALIIGAMKAGSTSLYRHLIQHPEIAANALTKEPDYFSVQPKRGFDWYSSQWRIKKGETVWALDASVSYSKVHQFPQAFETIAQSPGEYRLIFIMRDPVERMLSHYRHLVSRGYRSAGQVKKAEKHVLLVSSYAAQLDRVRRDLPDTPLHLLTLEQFKLDPLPALRKLAAFLQVDESFRFSVLPPQNVRKSDHDADQVHLDAGEREVLAQKLADDMRRLKADYGVDIDLWPSSRLI